MIPIILVFIFSLALLLWSADRFVIGASALARIAGMSPLLIGMIVVGFGTSAPEMLVSVLASADGNSGIALGNAYGSNITNIALILGLTALISPVSVHSSVLRRELPLLLAATALSTALLWDLILTRPEAVLLIGMFAALIVWSIRQSRREEKDALAQEIDHSLPQEPVPVKKALISLLMGLLLLIISSRALIWSILGIARSFGIPELILGLTVVALGTSLPELASSLAAARRREHDIAFGNIIGSNLFNTLAVVGAAAAVSPLSAGPEVLRRDIPIMAALTLSLFILGTGFGKRQGRINRLEGLTLLFAYVVYTLILIKSAF